MYILYIWWIIRAWFNIMFPLFQRALVFLIYHHRLSEVRNQGWGVQSTPILLGDTGALYHVSTVGIIGDDDWVDGGNVVKCKALLLPNW